MKKNDKDTQQRLEIVKSVEINGVTETSKIYKISRKTIYKWMKRYKEKGQSGLENKKRTENNHPSKMPLEIENKIIEIKKEQPNLTATEIKKKLNLNYELRTIIKKIKRHDKEQFSFDFKNSILEKKCKSLDYIILTVKKIQLLDNSLPNYYFVAIDYKTNIRLLSFTNEITELNISLFIIYLMEYFKFLNLKNRNINFIPLQKIFFRYAEKKNSLLAKTLVKYDLNFLELKKSNRDKARLYISAMKLNVFLKKSHFKNKTDLLINSYKFVLKRNYNIYASNDDLKFTHDESNIDFYMPIGNKELSKKITFDKKIFEFPPLVIDNIISVITKKNNDIIYNSMNELKKETILNLKAEAYKYKDKYENNTAIEKFNKIILLSSAGFDLESQVEAILKKGEILEYIGRFPAALACYKYILNIANKTKNNRYLLKSYNHLGYYYSVLGIYSKALENYNLSLELATKQKDDIGKYNAQKKIGEIHIRKIQFDKSIEFYNLALSTSKKINFTKGISSSYFGLAINYIAKGDIDQGVKFLKKAEKIALDINDRQLVMLNLTYFSSYLVNIDDFLDRYYDEFVKFSELANKKIAIDALEKLGTIALRKEKFETALTYYQRSLYLANETNHYQKICTISTNIGNIYWYQQKFKKALHFFKKGYKIATNINFELGIMLTTLNIGSIYSVTNKINKSLEFLTISMELAKQRDDKKSLVICYLNIGSIYYMKRKLNIAIKYYKKLLPIAKQIKDSRNVFLAHNNIGRAYQDLGKNAASMRNYNIAEEIADEMSLNYYLCEIKYNKATLLKENKKYKKCTELAAMALDIAIKIDRNDIIKKINPLLKQL